MYGKSRLSMTQRQKMERRSMDQMKDSFQYRQESRQKLFESAKRRKFPFFGLFGR